MYVPCRVSWVSGVFLRVTNPQMSECAKLVRQQTRMAHGALTQHNVQLYRKALSVYVLFSSHMCLTCEECHRGTEDCWYIWLIRRAHFIPHKRIPIVLYLRSLLPLLFILSLYLTHTWGPERAYEWHKLHGSVTFARCLVGWPNQKRAIKYARPEHLLPNNKTRCVML